jgi:hypothetical protein
MDDNGGSHSMLDLVVSRYLGPSRARSNNLRGTRHEHAAERPTNQFPAETPIIRGYSNSLFNATQARVL